MSVTGRPHSDVSTYKDLTYKVNALYLCFKEYLKRLLLLSTALKLRVVGSNPSRVFFFL
jgi:hypothetical protein